MVIIDGGQECFFNGGLVRLRTCDLEFASRLGFGVGNL